MNDGTRLLLVRHGESTWNADGRWQGQADPDLSARGIRQAREAARRVDGVAAVWTSDLGRARQTAGLLAGPHGLPVRVESRLRERDAGEWQGHTRDEIEARWPGYLTTGRRPPGYEDDASVLARALAALADVAAVHAGESVLVVTHGGVVRTLERHLGDDRPALLPNLGGRVILASGEGRLALGERVLLLHDTIITAPQQI